MTDKLGATGDFPLGKLNPQDEGGLMLQISREKGMVRIDFGTPTTWLAMPPDLALKFAKAVADRAMSIKRSGQPIKRPPASID
jgi:hypothetical protein